MPCPTPAPRCGSIPWACRRYRFQRATKEQSASSSVVRDGQSTHRISQYRDSPAHVVLQLRIHAVDRPLARLLEAPQDVLCVCAPVRVLREELLLWDGGDPRRVGRERGAADGPCLVGDEGDDVDLRGVDGWTSDESNSRSDQYEDAARARTIVLFLIGNVIICCIRYSIVRITPTSAPHPATPRARHSMETSASILTMAGLQSASAAHLRLADPAYRQRRELCLHPELHQTLRVNEPAVRDRVRVRERALGHGVSDNEAAHRATDAIRAEHDVRRVRGAVGEVERVPVLVLMRIGAVGDRGAALIEVHVRAGGVELLYEPIEERGT